MNETISPRQRFLNQHSPCPVCGGHAGMPQGKGIRCAGFLSHDGKFVHCTREDYAPGLPQGPGDPPTYAHLLGGECRCGVTHVPGPVAASVKVVPLPQRETHTVKRQEWAYHDPATGELLGIHLRADQDDGTKRMVWLGRDRLPSSKSAHPVTVDKLPLYLAADVAAHQGDVFLVEGEKCVEALRERGFVATTLAGGAMQRNLDALKLLAGKRVFLLRDEDAPGRDLMDRARLFLATQPGTTALLVPLPGIEELAVKGADVADWFAAGNTEEDLLRAVMHALAQQQQGRHPGIVLTRLADLITEPRPETAWTVAGLLPRGSASLWSAKPKAGKSTTIRTLLLEAATGGTFLGRSCTAGPVVYLCIEDHRLFLAEQLEAMGRSDAPLYIHTGPVTANGVPVLDQLEAVIEELGVQLVVVDPLFKFLGIPDGNDYATVSAALQPLTEIARRTGAHIAIIHHSNKGGEGQEAVLGSTALAGAVDTLVLMRREGATRTLSTVQRYGVDIEPTVLEMDERGRVDIAGTLHEQRVESIQADVLRLIQSGLHDPAALREATSVRQGVVHAALDNLVEKRLVLRDGSGTRGKPYRYYTPEQLPGLAEG